MSSIDLEDAFCFLMMKLDLKYEKEKPSLFKKHVPYSFNVKRAIVFLKKLEYSYGYGVYSSEIHITMQKDTASDLLVKMCSARLLHNPHHRTSIKLGDDTVLQPTAKGLAILQRFCMKNNIEHNLNDLFNSAYNSMKLVFLPNANSPHGTETRSIYFSMVLWNKILGSKPNLFYPERTVTDEPSPYFHKYLLHPSSNSLNQYYNSNGVRIFSELTFEIKPHNMEKIPFVVTGKSIWQWIMDCTNVLAEKEARALVCNFVNSGFLEEISYKLVDSVTCGDDMHRAVSRTTFYRLSSKFHSLCDWAEFLTSDIGHEDWILGHELGHDSISMEDIMGDSGLQFLFFDTLMKVKSDENLHFLLEWTCMESRFKSSRRYHEVFEDWKAITRMIFRYISRGSPLELNVPENLRASILSHLSEGTSLPPDLANSYATLFKLMNSVATYVRNLLSSLIPELMRNPTLQKLPVLTAE